jgi:phosphoserine/homoserine phosphotransferase
VELACLDLEGVLIPEIWVEFANKTGIEALKSTTRDNADYTALMQQRLRILDEHKLKLSDIQAVVNTLEPLPGADKFILWLRERFQVIILSDTFYELCQPLMLQLGFPTVLCHHLELNSDDRIVDFKLRQQDAKRQSVLALQGLYYRVVATGDSYNDISMLHQADAGILFNAPENVVQEHPYFPLAYSYEALQKEFVKASNRDLLL